MADLHLWEFGPDTVIATDADDVRTIMRGWIGNDDLSDYDDDIPAMIPDDQPVTSCDVDDPEHTTETKLAHEWATSLGRGFFSSEEF